jgi:hypothetical protein
VGAAARVAAGAASGTFNVNAAEPASITTIEAIFSQATPIW